MTSTLDTDMAWSAHAIEAAMSDARLSTMQKRRMRKSLNARTLVVVAPAPGAEDEEEEAEDTEEAS